MEEKEEDGVVLNIDVNVYYVMALGPITLLV